MSRGKRVLLIFGACILVMLNVLAVHLLLEGGVEHLPTAERYPIHIVYQQEVTGEDGRFGLDFRAYEIPTNVELFADYSALLAKLKLYPCKTDQNIEIDREFCQILYLNGSTENYQSVRLLFNADIDMVQVSINAPRAGISSETIYEAKNLDRWLDRLFKLLQKSEAYRNQSDFG